MSETTTEPAEDEEFVGNGSAADYLGLKRGTLSYYLGKGYGPPTRGKRAVGQYNLHVFLKSDLDHWKANRPGRGARTDRMHAGAGNECRPCGGICKVQLT